MNILLSAEAPIKQHQEEMMNKETQEQIALCRFKLISPILAEPLRAQNEYFRKQTQKSHIFPHYGKRKVKISTLKSWLRKYRQKGFDGLKPKARSDKGRPRRLDDITMAALIAKCKAFPHWNVRMLYEDLQEQELLGDPPICYNTLLRMVKKGNLMEPRKRTDARKRFEAAEFGDLWLCDFMHGPQVEEGGRRKKAILCAIIDDHSRMIVGSHFNIHETISDLTIVFKEAILTYGVPMRLYVDNGPAFSADLLCKSCALAGISLIHSKPYDSPSRGKIERFFRTVRTRFLPFLNSTPTLNELGLAFNHWLTEDYHHKIHTTLNQRPIDRYQAALGRIDIRRLSKSELETIFLVRHERVVNNDATISFKGRIYEVPAAYIRQRIEIRHPVDDPQNIALFDNGIRIAKLKYVDVKENARTFKPTLPKEVLSFAKGRVKK